MTIKTRLILLLFIAGIMIHLPFWNYHHFISTGDTGRDLYVFSRTALGDVPYRDYWWCYGPLMPYIYGTIMRIFGFSLNVILITQHFFYILSGLFFFAALSFIIPPSLAAVGCLWFWASFPGFFYTYNHSAGILLLIMIMYFFFNYINSKTLRHPWITLPLCFILAMIKINSGLAALCGIILAFVLINMTAPNHSWREDKKFFWVAGLVVVGIIGTYGLFLIGMPIYEIRQCIPFITSDQPHAQELRQTIYVLIQGITIIAYDSWSNRIFSFVLILSLIRVLYRPPSSFDQQKKQFFYYSCYLIIFILFNLHEYLLSGIVYRLFWPVPFAMALTLVLIFLLSGSSKLTRMTLTGALLCYSGSMFLNNYSLVQKNFGDRKIISFNHSQSIITNELDWIETVNKTTKKLRTILKKDELFFALPYDPLYYALIGTRSPTRQLMLLEHMNIPTEQDQRIIKDLEKNHVNVVLISNRSESKNPGIGVFGIDYCPLLADYIKREFVVIAEYGDWKSIPGWTRNHATRILQRKNPL